MRNVLPLLPLLLTLGCGSGQPKILSIASVTPESIVTGTPTTLTITGQRFDVHTSLLLGKVAVPVTVESSTSLTAAVPAGIFNRPGTYVLSLVDAEPPLQGGTVVLPTSFTITVGPAAQ